MATLPRSRTGIALRANVTLVTSALAVAALVELVILRTFTRTAIHIPALEAMQEPYGVLAFIGRYAYFVAVLLLVAALPGLAWTMAADRDRARVGGAAAIAAFMVAAGVATAGTGGRFMLDVVSLFAVVSLVGLAIGRWRLTGMLPLSMFGVAFATAGGYTLLQAANQSAGRATDPAWLLSAAEVSGVVFALSLPMLMRGHIDRVAIAIGLLAAALAFSMFVSGGGATSRILLLWNIGLSGTLPGTVYAVCAGGVAGAFVSLLRARQAMAAVGLALLVAGGLGLHNTYQTGLVIAGLAALCLAAPGVAGDSLERPSSGRRVS